ncbi:MAG: TlyA family RNA methyltransferase [Lachnospiraceae bacterium]|nr:TlyA family RNA methyltransferase [Butyrivibrio sp.]MCM1343925.1 TlyA family RNA methyltransferase [Muribaculaceae bacterium]MCM1412267.1 TlyA family RNA methyltransferase [Lachnospiraceae bacterium]
MKERLDVILVDQGYAGSREKAKAIIMSGNVYVDGQKEDKAGTAFDPAKISLEVRGSSLKYVSRGGLKLEKAMEKWQFGLAGKVCMDIGSSTGGFTDCMLQNGAAKVYAVDVGRGQLAWKLRNDPRVVCMEQTNFRYMIREDIREELDFASVDVSFISLTKILIPARNLLRPGGEMVCLIKPQFEAGRGKVGKNGVVREPEIHREVIGKIIDHADSIGFAVQHLDFSPIKGPEGNIEYLLHLKKEREPSEEIRELTEREAEERLQRIMEEKSGLSQREEWKKLIGETVENSHKKCEKNF